MAYETSALYKEAIKKESRVTFIDGEIKGTNGATILLNNGMLAPGSFYITNQCVNRDAFEFGSVFAAELGITLKTEIDRHTLYNAEIKPYFNIQLSDKTYERIPLGVFYINEPSRVGKDITIKAYDKMIDLEDDVVESTTGTPYDLLLFISERCKVQLAQTRAQIVALTNGTALLSVSPDKVSTYRELLSCICEVTCTFAIFDRNGNLKLCEYQATPSMKVDTKQRTSSKFSDFETYFSSVTGEFLFNEAPKGYTKKLEGDGLDYDMGSVPIVQGVDETNFQVVSNVLSKLSALKYTPCTITFSGDPSIDLGDMIKSVDRNGNEIVSLVTFYKWGYRGSHQIKSAGQNPKLLKSKERTNKEIANLRNDVSSKDVGVYTYTNSSKINMRAGAGSSSSVNRSIATLSFSSKKAATCMVLVTIPLYVTVESDVIFHQFFDDLEMLGGTIAQYCHLGSNTITFVNYFNTKSNYIHRYSVVAESKGIVQSPVEVDVLTIDRYALKVVIFGQGLSSVVQWDGNVNISDAVPVISIDAPAIVGIDDEVSTYRAERTTSASHTITEVVATIPSSEEIPIVGISEVVRTEIDV